jgi:hypothetical protein
MSDPSPRSRSRRKYWIMLGAVPLVAVLLLLAFLLLAGGGERESFVYTLF